MVSEKGLSWSERGVEVSGAHRGLTASPGLLQQAGPGVPVCGLWGFLPATPGQSVRRPCWQVSTVVWIGRTSQVPTPPAASPPTASPYRVKFSAACGPPVTPECQHCGQRHQVGPGQRGSGPRVPARMYSCPLLICTLCVRSLEAPCGQTPSMTWTLWAESLRQ